MDDTNVPSENTTQTANAALGLVIGAFALCGVYCISKAGAEKVATAWMNRRENKKSIASELSLVEE